MAIHPPGHRKGKRLLRKNQRPMVATLSLTAMVDMFTVLVVFLLMNYKSTDTVLYLPKEVTLPSATETKELKPAHVVTISEKEILLDKDVVSPFYDVKEQRDWDIVSLRTALIEAFRRDELDYKSRLSTALRSAVQADKEKVREELGDNRRKITIQADKEIDFLTIKKVMYTVTEAGAREINFAVIAKPPQADEGN